MGALAKFVSWILQKLTLSFAVLLLGVAGFALWIFLREHVDLETHRQELLRTLTGESRRIRAALDGVELRIAELQSSLVRQEQRAREAARLAADLEEQSSGLKRLTTPDDQLRKNEDRLRSLRSIETAARAEVAKLRPELNRAEWERDGLKIALGKLDARVREAEQRKSQVIHYAREAWARYGLYVGVVVLIWLLAPPLGRLTAYFIVAPFVSAQRPVRLHAEARGTLPVVTPGSASIPLTLEPGEVLWVKESFLQGSDEGLMKATRWLLDWRMPFTCFAAGLTELVELRNAAPAAHLGVTLSSQRFAHVELAMLTLPAGTSIVLRPRFLAGIAGPLGRKRMVIRKHWRLFSLQAWATGQFRYFEFVGPCRLLIAGGRGVRTETLVSAGQSIAARRANQEATIGFTPGLAYRPVRAETFWAYFRGQNALFDDLFEGDGVFLCQQTAAPVAREGRSNFLARLRDGLLRIFGL